MKRKWARSYTPHIQFKGGKIYYKYATLHFIFSLATKFQEITFERWMGVAMTNKQDWRTLSQTEWQTGQKTTCGGIIIG